MLLLVGCALLGVCASCDSTPVTPAGEAASAPSTPTYRGRHASEQVLTSYLEAFLYRDATLAFEADVASSEQGRWCAMGSFRQLLTRLSAEQDAQKCAHAREVTSSEEAFAALDAEQALMVQTLRFVCEHPKGSCRDYARQVYGATLSENPYWRERLQGYEVARVVPSDEGSSATAHVELDYAQPFGKHRETVELRRLPDGWRVTRGLAAEEGSR